MGRIQGMHASTNVVQTPSSHVVNSDRARPAPASVHVPLRSFGKDGRADSMKGTNKLIWPAAIGPLPVVPQAPLSPSQTADLQLLGVTDSQSLMLRLCNDHLCEMSR